MECRASECAKASFLNRGVQVEQEQRVVVVDVNMKFGSMVVFLVKLAVASIPAALILLLLGAIFGGIFTGIFAGLARRV